jgi:riboflavin kinase/FMN adenylyltransferase
LKVHYDFSGYNVHKPVVTTGVFDGVHKGHVEILARLNNATKTNRGESVVLTFWPHPRLVLNHDPAIKLLNTLDEKLNLLEKARIQHVVILPFTEEFSKLSSEDFVIEVMVNKLKVNHLIIGFNHHFGKGREGNFETMQAYADKYKFTVEKLDAQIIENEKVSSTLIRKALATGDVNTANKYLGYDYMLTGKVVEGNKIGRTIGFPTANLQIDHDFKLIPLEGVYAVRVEVAGRFYNGMLNMGYRPTIDERPNPLSIEVHLINFSGNLYGKDITLHFKHRIRNEMKFAGIEHLKRQLELDKAEVVKLLGA